MGDDSSRSIVKALKNEWSLFMEAFSGESEESRGSLLDEKVEVLSLEQLRQITKSLSESRKKLNQKLEVLNKELDLNSAKLESLRLVGGDKEETIRRINELSDIGHSVAETLHKLDEKLKVAREKEVELREDLISSST